ncbi:MAG TPA: phosphoheptose isomerase [Candidatus Omnitrophica bacterium]|nr:MAG: hypothetical protein A2Y04_05105 [Omnitrophica WOR_2 bacterium GWC2_45_7]HBR15732.1 phosphoheptose isomerase [Candidatus Omnitrophota bacterium]
MIEQIKNHRNMLKELYDGVVATDHRGNALPLDGALEKVIHVICEQACQKRKLIFIGNGGSAAIASHMAVDFWKNIGIKAITFNDSTLLTCLSNDIGYAYAFEKSIEIFGEEGDVLMAISSSGKSENILRGVAAAKKKRLKVVTFSGFDEHNPLRSEGEYNFYVPIAEYGYVEAIHHLLCHCLVDILLLNKSRLSEITHV